MIDTDKYEVERLEALIRSKGLCTNCGQSHEGVQTVVNRDLEDEYVLCKECSDVCHPQGDECCDLCLCLNGFTIEHAYWEAKE